jgi:hypothetical protein
MTHDSSHIPERWLDLLTGYIGVGFAIIAGILGAVLLLQ